MLQFVIEFPVFADYTEPNDTGTILEEARPFYPSGRIAELLDILEKEHQASMERNAPQREG